MESKTIVIKYLNSAVTRLKKIDKGDMIDLYAAETIRLHKGESTLVHLGVAMKLPEGYEAHLYPRSSTFKKWNVIQTNSVGIIDNSYCGPNDWWKMPVYAVQDTIINAGDKICQFRIFEKQPSIEFVEGTLEENADRGGFGSTGSK